MNSTTYRTNEKNTPVWREIEPPDTTKHHRRRVLLAKGLAIAAVLFLWWSYHSVPGLIGCRKTETVADADGVEGYRFDDFESVGYYPLSHITLHNANFHRSPQVRSWNGTNASRPSGVLVLLYPWTTIVHLMLQRIIRRFMLG
jgi:hypothetical protein